MCERPVTTLFLLMSVDGKISTGAGDALDVDRDFPRIEGVREGLHQYYELEGQTDLWSLNTGRVMQKIGINERMDDPQPIPVSFVIIDNRPHLTDEGVRYLSRWVKQLVLVTTCDRHPAEKLGLQNVTLIKQQQLDLRDLLDRLKSEYGVERLTVQSGGTLNERFLRENLLDYVHVVMAPILIGGKDTPSLVDGSSITDPSQLTMLGPLQLEECNVLKDSYIQLKYQVVNSSRFPYPENPQLRDSA